MTIADVVFPSAMERELPSGPKGLPLLGNLMDIKRDTLNFFVNMSKDYGDIVPYKIGTDRVFLINNPEYVRYVLTLNQRNYGKGKFFAKAKPLMGGAMVMSDGDKWLKLRRTALPAIQGKALPQMAEPIVDAVDDVIARFRGNVRSGTPLDIAPEMTKLAMDVVFRTLFRVNFDYDADRVYDALSAALGEVEQRIWSLTPISEYLPTRRQAAFRRNIKVLDDVVRRVIETRRADPNEYGDLLSVFIRATDDPENMTYTEKQLRDECINFVIVGRDTAAGALIWSLYLLSRHPAVERRLRQEVDDVLGGRRPTYEDVEKMPYMRMVLDEAMRLYPPGWTFSRMALEDDRIGDVDIPKGSAVQMCVYAMHRNPRYWDNPEAFDPERFSPERSKGRPQFAYLPFGGGGRVCIGRKLALMEGALVISRLLQSFQFDLVPGQKIEIEPMITLRPKHGLKMTLRDAEPAGEAAAAPVRESSAPAERPASAGGCPFAAAHSA